MNQHVRNTHNKLSKHVEHAHKTEPSEQLQIRCILVYVEGATFMASKLVGHGERGQDNHAAPKARGPVGVRNPGLKS